MYSVYTIHLHISFKYTLSTVIFVEDTDEKIMFAKTQWKLLQIMYSIWIQHVQLNIWCH